MSVRAKFECTSAEHGEIKLQPVYGESEENKKFFEATPGGSINLSIVNEAASSQFEVGKEYYVDFTEA